MSVLLQITDDISVLSLATLCKLTLSKFHQNACDFQLEFAQAILNGKKHVLLQAGCGMGKTLGFLAWTLGSLIVVTPLTLLGNQHMQNLTEVGISAINIDADTIASCPHVFEVIIFMSINKPNTNDKQDIRSGAYHVMITSLEQLMKEGGDFQQLLRKTKFTSQLITIIIDEVHCLKLWNSFRHDYQDLGRLQFILPDQVHFTLVLATLPHPVLMPVLSHLGVTSKDLYAIWLSNNCDNIALVVWKMKDPAGSYWDLDFLVPGNAVSDTSGSSQ